MAGERMRLDRAVEISAVCVSPEIAAKATPRFSSLGSSASFARRRQPFLHVFTDNPAIALYERLGFRRAEPSA